jgi:hypothetical protein
VGVIAFLFSTGAAGNVTDDGEVLTRIVRTLIAQAKAGAPVPAGIRDSYVSFEEFAYRLTEVTTRHDHRPVGDRYSGALDRPADLSASLDVSTYFVAGQWASVPGKPELSVGTMAVADAHVVTYLMAEFAHAYREAWHIGDAGAIDAAVAQGALSAYAVGPIPRDTGALVHRELTGVAGYLGAVEVDLGHPVLFRVLWSGWCRRTWSWVRI